MSGNIQTNQTRIRDMAEPTQYDKDYDFSAFQSTKPDEPLPGDRLDTELQNIETALDETQGALRDIRRSDGQLQNDIVSPDSLSEATLIFLGASTATAESVETVADNIDDITTVADNVTAVTTVSGSMDDVTAVADNMPDVTSVADNMAAITAAEGNAQLARKFAENPEDVEVDDVDYPGEYSARHYAAKAKGKADEIQNLTADATGLSAGVTPTADYDPVTGVLSFGIPAGEDWPDAPNDGKIYGRENGSYTEVVPAAAVQSGSTDNADGKLLKVNGQEGSFGLGATHAPDVTNDDADDIVVSGMYRTTNDTVSVPVSGYGNSLYHSQFSEDHATQLVIQTSADGMFFRRKRGGVWYTPAKVVASIGDHSMNGDLSLLNGDPTDDAHAVRKKYVDDRVAEGIRTLRSFGAVGDATQDSGGGNFAGTDDTAAIQSACTWMTGATGRILDGEGRQYLLTDTVSGIGSFRIVGKPKFLKSTDGPAFDFRPACYGPVKLASNYTKGGTNLSLASGIPAGFRQGTPMKIVSDAVDGANRDKGSAALQYRTGEWFLSQSGSTSTSLNLQAPLRFTEGIDPTSVAGEEAEIDAYTTAMNARVVFPDPYAICDCDIIVSAQNVGAVWSGDLVRLFGYVRPTIRLAVERAYGPGLSVCAYEGSVIDMSVENCADNPGNSQYGYGIANAGSYGLTVRGLKGANCRHVYSASVGRLEADSGAHWQLLGVGRTVGGDISGKGYGGSSAIWDTHHSSQDETFHEIYAEGGDLWAMNVRGRGVDVRGLKSRNCHSGFIALTEYESGDTDDDLFTAGKGAQWFTSCRLIDADLDTHTGELLNNSHAFFDVGGTGRYRSNQHVFLNQSGGITRITGNHYMKVSGTPVGSGSDGIFTINAPDTNADEAFPDGAICYIDGNVEIDARGALDDIDAFDIATGARLIVRGFLKIIVPDEGSSYIRNSVYPEVEGSGVIEYWEGDTLAEAHYAPVKAFKQDTAAQLYFDASAIGGAEISVDDDSVFEIKPPRAGGFLLVTAKGGGGFPQVERSGIFWFDVGTSNILVRLDPTEWAGTSGSFGANAVVSATALTGTTGVDGDLTIHAKNDGKLQFENRSGAAIPISLTFL